MQAIPGGLSKQGNAADCPQIVQRTALSSQKFGKLKRMALPVQKFREMVFQMLFSCDAGLACSEEDLVSMMMHELKVTRKSALEASRRVAAILDQREEIDQKIRSVSVEYQFERISMVEKNVLRLGVFELFFDQIQPKIAIAEAIRLCRKFGSPEGSQFVNAILDCLYKTVSTK